MDKKTALKMQHNALAQRTTSILALAELIQDYRVFTSQLIAEVESLSNENQRLIDLFNCATKTAQPDDRAISTAPPKAPANDHSVAVGPRDPSD